MKHNVLTTLLVGLLTLVGVSQVWAETPTVRYNLVTSEAVRVYDAYFSVNVPMPGNVIAKWIDTDEAVDANARSLAANESATMKFAAVASIGSVMCDVVVKVTPSVAINTTWIGKTISVPRYNTEYQHFNIQPNISSGEISWIDYEFWLEKDGKIVDMPGFMALACGLEAGEYVRFYGLGNVIYSNIPTAIGETFYNYLSLVYNNDEQAWCPECVADIFSYFGSIGTDESLHSKISYKRKTGSAAATFIIGYQDKLGPWAFSEMKTDWRSVTANLSLSMDELNCKMVPDYYKGKYRDTREIFANYHKSQNKDRRGFWFYDEMCENGTQMAIYSLYRSTQSVPAYTKVVLNWKWCYYFDYDDFAMPYGYYPLADNCGANYIFNSYEEARSTAVNATYDQGSAAGPANRINYAFLTNSSGFECKSPKVTALTYDNSQGEETKDIDLWMLMTNVAAPWSAGSSYTNFQLNFANGDCGTGGGIISTTTYHSTVLKFDANGGSGTMDPQVIDAVAGGTKAVAIKANTFTYTKHTFIGWNTEADGSGTSYAPGAQYSASDATMGEHTLYAQWADNITVTFDGNGGTPSLADKEVYNGGTYGDLPTATNGNLYFDGWFTLAEGGEKITSSTVVTETTDHNVYAHWLPVYTCTFEVNGEGGSVDPTSKYVAYNRPYDVLPTPTRPGYTFNKWWTDAEGGTEVTAATLVPVAQDHSIYAHWTANKYTVTFNKNGGSSQSKNNMQVTYDAAYGTLATATHATHTFAGWWTAQTGGDQVTAETTVKTPNNHTLWAHWYIPEVTDGTGMDFTPAKDAANDSLTSWAAKSTGSNTINVVIKRTIYKDGYFNTLCVPFDLTAAQITQTFGTYKELKEYLSCSVQGTGDDRELVIETQDATTIEAGKAYLISFANGTNLTELLFQGVQVTEKTPIVAETSGEASYQGILAPKVLPYGDEDYLFLGEENRLYWPKNDGTFLRGFRAYFKVETSPEPQAPVKRGMKASFGRTVPTSNNNVNVNDNEVRKLVEEGRVVIMSNGVKYDMNGRKIVD